MRWRTSTCWTNRGVKFTGAFLALDQELWDPVRRRITLLFDPGRVKRGVRTNLESGAPLVAGRRYRLVIDDALAGRQRRGAGVGRGAGVRRGIEADRRRPTLTAGA